MVVRREYGGGGRGVDIILKGHGGEMEVVVVVVVEGAREGEMSREPRQRCHVRRGGGGSARRPSAAGFNQMAAAADRRMDGEKQGGGD